MERSSRRGNSACPSAPPSRPGVESRVSAPSLHEAVQHRGQPNRIRDHDVVPHVQIHDIGVSDVPGLAWVYITADILVENTNPSMNDAHFFLQYNAGHFSDAPQDEDAASGIREVSNGTFDSLGSCPKTGYQTHRVPPSENSVYCVRTRDGQRFAAILVTEVLTDRIAFDWKYPVPASK